MTRFIQVALASAVLGALAFPAQAAQRVFVASYGSDANAGAGCLLNAPCRGFTAALGAVDSGGEIVALDAAGYGAVTITKSVTITANPGYFAGIAASTGNAVTIATPGVNVTLRSLNLNGIGAAYGVLMTNGARLTVENCVISGFSSDGIHVATAAALRVMDSTIRDNFNGIYVTGGATASINTTKLLGNGNMGVFNNGSPIDTTTTVAIVDSVTMNNFVGFYTSGTAGAFTRSSITRTTASNNSYGFASEGTGSTIMTISNSMATGNASYGFYQNGGTNVLESQGNNTVRNNGNANTTGTITPAAGI